MLALAVTRSCASVSVERSPRWCVIEACFSGPSIALLGIVAGAVQATIIALFVALMKSKDAQIAKAEVRESEWRRLAVRGADEIIPSLASEVRGQAQDLLRELREPR